MRTAAADLRLTAGLGLKRILQCCTSQLVCSYIRGSVVNKHSTFIQAEGAVRPISKKTRTDLERRSDRDTKG